MGRSNVGKSSLINCLLRRRGLARVSATPGRTQLLNYFLINQDFYLVDLPATVTQRRPMPFDRRGDRWSRDTLPHAATSGP